MRKLTDAEIDEMCQCITDCDLRGDELVAYVKGFLSDCEEKQK